MQDPVSVYTYIALKEKFKYDLRVLNGGGKTKG